MKNRTLKVALILLLIITMTLSNFLLVGMNLITYALENIDNTTSNNNVKFAAYFKTEEGKEVSQVASQINNSNIKLFMEVSVENEGYFDGVITLENSNFKLKTNSTSEAVKKIEGNVITLNRVREGNTAVIELGIEPIIEEIYEENMLNKESILKLTGNYRNSADENISIQAEKKVTLNLLSPSDLNTTLTAKVITNRIYKIGDANKRIVQLAINSNVNQNAYPVQKTIFEIQTPANVQEVKVHTKGTYSTNGVAEQILDTDNNKSSYYAYDSNNNILKVEIRNLSQEGKIAWRRNAEDKVVVTVVLNENENLAEELDLKAITEFYGTESKKIEKQATYNLSEEKEGIIRASIENKEQIYKGKLYSQEEREYKSTTNIEVNYANLIEGNTVEEKVVYRTENEDKVSNTQYKITTISKSEFDKILGAEGKLTIKDQNGNLIREIRTTDFDENGNITITYAEGVKALKIELTKAIEIGIIRLNHTKTIKPESYTRAEIEDFKYLVEQAKVKCNTSGYSFEIKKELRETTSEAGLTVTPQVLTAETNRDLQMSITLKTDNEKYELFANPSFILTVPERVTVNSVSTGTISASDGNLNISKLQVINARQIRVEIKGTQQKYITSNINTQINFTANVSIQKLMPNKIDTIKMEYTNRKITNQTESEKINIVASMKEVLTYLQLENFNGKGTSIGKYSDSTQDVQAKIPMENTEIIEVPIKYTIVNNNKSETTVTPKIIATLTKQDGKVENIHTYEGKQITLQPQQIQTIEQTLKLPVGLYYSEVVNVEAIAEYTSAGVQHSEPNNIKLATETKEGIRDITVIDNKIQVETFAQLGDGTGIKESDEIYNEQIVSYIMQVTNISNKPISNIKLTNTQDNGKIYDLKEVVVTNAAMGEGESIEHIYAELDTNQKIFEIEKLNPGQSREVECRVRIRKSENANITTANINVLANGITQTNIKKISNNIKDSQLKLVVKNYMKEEVEIYGNSVYALLARIDNLANRELKDVKVKLHLSEGLVWTKDSTIEVYDETLTEVNIISGIKYNEIENYIEFTIDSINSKQGFTLRLIPYTDKIPLEQIQKQVSTYMVVNGIVTNAVKSNIKQEETKLEAVQNVNISKEHKLKDGETVIITGKITNAGAIDTDIVVEDYLPEGLEVTRVTTIKDGKRTDDTENYKNGIILMSFNIKRGELITFEIEAKINTSRIVKETIENEFSVSSQGTGTISNKVILNIESTIDDSTGTEEPEIPVQPPEDPKDPEEPKPDENPEQKPSEKPDENPEQKPTDPEQPSEPEKEEYTISGYVWVDKNRNNIKDLDENLKDVVVKIIDLNNKNTFLKDENGKEIRVTTSENGEYKIENIAKGEYSIIFEYDTNLYELEANSEVKDYIIEDSKQKVAITSNIELNSNKESNLKLVEIPEFDLRLDKYITKVIVQSANGTKTTEYANQKLAREEILKKYMKGSIVLVEYTIDVSNVGELEGYATEIIDYLPKDMEFYSELNKQWYMGKDGNLYSTSLANTSIKPGQKQTLKLILSKTMTNENNGTSTNIAEISAEINNRQYVDIDPQNNQSKAEIIVGTATGKIIAYVVAILNSIIIIAVGMYIIKKKVMK